jgi:hypothetical protein
VFSPRCDYVMDRCRVDSPPLTGPAPLPGIAAAGGQRIVACWLQDGTVAPPAPLARPEPGHTPPPEPAAAGSGQSDQGGAR